MSQLNNINEPINNEDIINNSNMPKNKKMKTSTKIIIFLVIFTLISISFTIAAIYYTNSKPEVISTHTANSKIEDDGLGVQRITEQYNENDLKIIDVSDKKGSRTPKHEWDEKTGKVNINYIKIDGLKNTSIENQINNEIKNLVYSLYSDNELKDSKIDRIDIDTYCQANFGNTLSVTINKTIFYINDKSEISETSYTLNYDLTTGNKIKFIDLFTNTSLKNVLIQSIYDNIITNYTYIDSPDGTIDMSKADLSTVEDETYVLLNKLMNNLDNINFYYTPSHIFINDYDLLITMSDIYSSIAIYKRYMTTDSIFDGTYEGNKNMFVFSERILYKDIQYSKYEDIYNNLRVEVSIEMNNEQLSDSLAKEKLNEIIKKVESEISQIKKEAKNNPKEAFIYTAYFSLYAREDYELSNLGIKNNTLNTWGESKVYKMTKEYYANVFLEKIAVFHNSTEKVDYWPVFMLYGEDNDNVLTQTISEINEDIDLYTNKTPDQLIGEYYINQHKTNLEELLNSLNNNIDCGDVESYLEYIKDSIVDIQKEYNFTNNDIKEILTLIEKIEKANEEQKTVTNDTLENSSTSDTGLVLENTIENTTTLITY